MNTKQLKKLTENIPSSVRITKNVSYEVVFIDQFPNPKVLGECRYDKKQIVIKTGMNSTLTIRTLIHEVFHAISMENDFDLTEKQVLALEDGVFRVARLNNILDLFSRNC